MRTGVGWESEEVGAVLEEEDGQEPVKREGGWSQGSDGVAKQG